MIEDAQEITYRTFTKYVSVDHVRSILPGVFDKHPKQGLTLKSARGISFYKSHWEYETVYYLVYSGIEFIFRKNWKTNKLSYMQQRSKINENKNNQKTILQFK